MLLSRGNSDSLVIFKHKVYVGVVFVNEQGPGGR